MTVKVADLLSGWGFAEKIVLDGRRCVNKPQVCQSAAKALQKSPLLSLAATNNAPVEVYSSQASCCRPGLGAFDNGCSFDA